MDKLKKFLSKLPHPVRFAVTLTIGFILLIIGILGTFLPVIPGVVFILLGLSILALELEWARELNKQGMQGLERIVARIKSFFKPKKK